MKEYFDKTQHEYFKGHKDSAAINEFLNVYAEDSEEFKIVYQLRQMGEKFNDGILTLREVSESSRWFQNVCASHPSDSLSSRDWPSASSDSTEAFIKQMRCWTFYTTLRAIASGNELTSFQQKVKDEIEHPSFVGPAITITQKFQRIWKVRWKHPLVFNEPTLARIITRVWSVVRMERIVKD